MKSLSKLVGGLFRKRATDRPGPATAGPLRLDPGDRVTHYRRTFTVVWSAALTEDAGTRHQYHLADEHGRPMVLVAEEDRELVLSLQGPVDRPLAQPAEGAFVSLAGRRLLPARRGEALVSAAGNIPGDLTATVVHREYVDDEEEKLVVFERWGDRPEVRAGEYVHEGELAFERQADDGYRPRTPPRIDAEALREAQQNSPKPVKHGTKTRRELDAIRQKLRERMGDPSMSP